MIQILAGLFATIGIVCCGISAYTNYINGNIGMFMLMLGFVGVNVGVILFSITQNK